MPRPRTYLLCCFRRASSYRRMLLYTAAIFITCWVVLLVLQNSTVSKISNAQSNARSDEKLLFAKLNDQNNQGTRGQGEQELLRRNRTLKETVAIQPGSDLKGKNTPRVLLNANILRKSLSTNVLSQTNRTNSTKSHPDLRNVLPKLDAPPSLNEPNSLQLLRNKLVKLNLDERILNADRFPPLASDGLVIIIQVHKRVGYLRQLFGSLKAARGIDKVLLVISHDYYYDEMNELVESVDFCRVLQIFYPFSLQLFPDVFPGQSKTDCPRNTKKEQALKMNCTNALHPDSFGHYREAAVTAIKHHWWWKVNTVFDWLHATRDFNGYVFFLEEDHYVSPDFVQVTKKLIILKQTSCQDCDFINLGNYQKANYGISGKQAFMSTWNAGKHNMGFGMDRATWNSIKRCSQKFCVYDDYNWDWSLNSLGTTCLGKKLKVLVSKAPRTLHIGACGTHHHGSCNEVEQARVAQAKFNQEMTHLFPDSLQLLPGVASPGPKKLRNYGGWGDVRDHELCLGFSLLMRKLRS